MVRGAVIKMNDGGLRVGSGRVDVLQRRKPLWTVPIWEGARDARGKEQEAMAMAPGVRDRGPVSQG